MSRLAFISGTLKPYNTGERVYLRAGREIMALAHFSSAPFDTPGWCTARTLTASLGLALSYHRTSFSRSAANGK